MLRFAIDKFRYANKVEAFLPAIRSAYDKFESRPISDGGEQAILSRIDELFTITQRAAYANIVAPILMYSYNALLKRRLAKRGVDFVQLDMSAGLDRLQDYDPSYHLSRLNRRFLALDSDSQQQIRTSNYAEFQKLDGLESFQQDVSEFIESFGHLSDSGNDFSKRPWRETPDLLLQMAVEYDAGDIERSSPLHWDDLSLSRLDRWELYVLYHRARQFRFYREAVSFQYTYGYGLFRQCFLSMGESFTNRGLIEEPEDIFYLYYDEVESLVKDGPAAASQKELVAARKQEMETTRDLQLPDIIYGNQAPPLEIASTDSDRMVGIATSPGYYQGPVRVIRSLAEFEQVRPGDVLVIPYSDVSWTPLFAKAGAVVAESGGILSHSSIVAREHGLPAVVSVTGACQLLSNGTVVLVDGYKGEVIVSQDGDRPQ
jgi:pyruvate,water dikinase